MTTLNQNSTQPPEPQLAPPGAGLGLPATLMLRYVVRPFVAAKSKRSENQVLFGKVNQKILKEIEGLSEDLLNARVLVPPQRGLEDSSRYWSVKMTLEHLIIVSTQKYKLITELNHGRVPDSVASTATVKPKNEMSADETVLQFKKLITTDFERLNQNFTNESSPTKYMHPWFGLMTANEWYWLLGVHHGLHLKQIREIKKRLPLL